MESDQHRHEETPLPDWLYSCKKHGTATYERTYSVFYHNKMVFQLLEDYQKKHGIKFDTVVMYRADIEPENQLVIQTPKPNTLYVPKDHQYLGLCGMMAYGTFDTMKQYCSLVDNLKQYCETQITELNHEMMLAAHIRSLKIPIEYFDYKFHLHPSRKEERPEYVEGDSAIFKKNP